MRHVKANDINDLRNRNGFISYPSALQL